MELLESIINRRTHRESFSDENISTVHLNHLIEAARWAPSPFNVQPWHLVVITTSQQKRAIGKLTADAIIEQFGDPEFLDDNSRWMRSSIEEWVRCEDGVLLQDQVNLPAGLSKPSILKPVVKHASYFSKLGKVGGGKPAEETENLINCAPMLLAISMDRNRKPPGAGHLRWMWLGMGAMIQNILLAATELKIGSQFISAAIERPSDREKLSKILDLPSWHEVISLLRIGYLEKHNANETTTHSFRSVRRKTTDFVSYETYSQKKADEIKVSAPA